MQRRIKADKPQPAQLDARPPAEGRALTPMETHAVARELRDAATRIKVNQAKSRSARFFCWSPNPFAAPLSVKSVKSVAKKSPKNAQA
jgi:hypothetical protein